MRYKNKVAVITGGNSGIGLETAKKLSSEGAKVAICGRDSKSLKLVADEHGFLAIKVDVSNLSEIDDFYKKVTNSLGKIDLLFANAGIYKSIPLIDTTEELYDEIVDINFKGLFFTVQKSIPHMNSDSAIVLTSSVLNQKAWAGNSIYSATKAAVRSLARTFAVDLLEKKIRVNTISPGPTFTPIFGRLGLSDDDLNNISNQIMSSIPLKRFGTSEDIANAVLFLGCSDSAFMTGAEIVVDGGLGQV